MKSHRHVIHVRSDEAVEVVDITAEVSEAVRNSGVREGLALVFPLHTTAGVFINDSDPSVTMDLLDVLDRVVPAHAGYRHDGVDPKRNAPGHLKGTLIGHHVVLPVTDGRLDFGAYHTVYYAELDGRRDKEILVKVLGD